MNLRDNKLASNIPKFYLFQILWMFWLVFAVNVVFYRANGISISRITMIDVVWALAAFATEVPTGALSNRWSRKYILALSSLFAGVGFFILSFSSTLVPFLIATVFMALRHTFASGTANALVYDTLKSLKKEQRFEKVLGDHALLGGLSRSRWPASSVRTWRPMISDCPSSFRSFRPYWPHWWLSPLPIRSCTVQRVK